MRSCVCEAQSSPTTISTPASSSAASGSSSETARWGSSDPASSILGSFCGRVGWERDTGCHTLRRPELHPHWPVVRDVIFGKRLVILGSSCLKEIGEEDLVVV